VHELVLKTKAKKTFKIQKRVIRIIANKGRCDTWRHIFKQFNILTLPSQYVFSVMGFLLENRHLFVSNNAVHDHDTRNGPNLHITFTHLTNVQKGVIHSGCKIFNHLPLSIKEHFYNPKHFKKLLKNYLMERSFYSLDEFYQASMIRLNL
jgi:hypothetical protein